MPAFRREGLTDVMARDLTLVNLKALGLGTMSHALQFKSHVAEFLSGAIIAKPHAAAASGVCQCRGLWEQQQRPLPHPSMTIITMCLPLSRLLPPALHMLVPRCTIHLCFLSPTFRRSSPISSTPNPQHPPAHSHLRTQELHHGAAAGPSCRCRWIHAPCPPLLLSPLQLRPRSPPPSRYERSSIQQWLALGHTTSPKSGALLPSTAPVPNYDLRARVQEWVQVREGGLIGDA